MRIFCIAGLAAALATWCVGQTAFATLTGAVTDPNGSLIPGATVTVTQAGSNYRYSTKANEAGIYTLAQLREGVYTLTAPNAGFKEAVIQNVQLVPLDVRRLDVRLEIGAVETKVEVYALHDDHRD